MCSVATLLFCAATWPCVHALPLSLEEPPETKSSLSEAVSADIVFDGSFSRRESSKARRAPTIPDAAKIVDAAADAFSTEGQQFPQAKPDQEPAAQSQEGAGQGKSSKQEEEEDRYYFMRGANFKDKVSPERLWKILKWAAVVFCICIVAFASMLKLSMAWAPYQEHPRSGSHTIQAIVLMTSFRFYGGFYMCTWLPYILTHESANFWAENQSLMMAGAKGIVGAALATLPLLGYLNDHTAHSWGRRRIWYACGFVILCFGILSSALVSASREVLNDKLGPSGAGWVYLITVLIWASGETIADSSSEAMIPDVCSMSDFNRGSSARSVTWLVGGLCGYISILIVSNVMEESYHWFYVLYLVTVCVSAPWALWYCAPKKTEMETAEREAAEQERTGSDGWGNILNESYWKVFNVTTDFRLMCISTFLWSMSACGFSWILLTLRDVIEVADESSRSLHFSALCIVGLIGAVTSSMIVGFLDADPKQSYKTIKVSMLAFVLVDLIVPLPFYVTSNISLRLGIIYVCSVWKGLAFGVTLCMMTNCFWMDIPNHWRLGVGGIGKGMALTGTCRTTGAAIGNVVLGLVLHFAGEIGGTKAPLKPIGNDPMNQAKYPVEGYIVMHILCFMSGIIAVYNIWNVTADGKEGWGTNPAELPTNKWETVADDGPREGEPLLEPEPEGEDVS